MKDKLIGLINQVRGDEIALANYEVDILADHLIANGVILPPCKVGDTVYCLVSSFTEPMEGRVRNITIFDTFSVFEIAVNGYYAQRRSNKDFGKTVFLTKEDAEKALKEKENG